MLVSKIFEVQPFQCSPCCVRQLLLSLFPFGIHLLSRTTYQHPADFPFLSVPYVKAYKTIHPLLWCSSLVYPNWCTHSLLGAITFNRDGCCYCSCLTIRIGQVKGKHIYGNCRLKIEKKIPFVYTRVLRIYKHCMKLKNVNILVFLLSRTKTVCSQCVCMTVLVLSIFNLFRFEKLKRIWKSAKARNFPLFLAFPWKFGLSCRSFAKKREKIEKKKF